MSDQAATAEPATAPSKNKSRKSRVPGPHKVLIDSCMKSESLVGSAFLVRLQHLNKPGSVLEAGVYDALVAASKEYEASVRTTLSTALSGNSKHTRDGAKVEKDPRAPKGPRNGFLFYGSDPAVINAFKAENPDITQNMLMSQAGKVWRDGIPTLVDGVLTKESDEAIAARKEPYLKLAEQDMLRWEAENAAYHQLLASEAAAAGSVIVDASAASEPIAAPTDNAGAKKQRASRKSKADSAPAPAPEPTPAPAPAPAKKSRAKKASVDLSA